MTAPAVRGGKTKPKKAAAPAVAQPPGRLAEEFENLGLGPAEARTVVALLRLGSARGAQLATEAGVPRTSIYQIIRALQDKGLVTRLPGGGTALWTTPGQDQVLDRLHAAKVAAQQQEVDQHALRTTLLREMLAESLPARGQPKHPYVHILTCPAQLRDETERLISQATTEVLVFNRPPYSTNAKGTYAATRQARGRGVTFRTLYQSAQADDPEAVTFRASADAYKAQGLEARVVDELRVKLLIVDRSTAIIALDDPVLYDAGFPVTLLIEHPGFASHEADLFEQLWATGRPYGQDAPTPDQ